MDPLVWTILRELALQYLCPAVCLLGVFAFVVFIIVDCFWIPPRD